MPTKVKKLRRKLKREVKQMEQFQLTAQRGDCETEKCKQCQGEIFVHGFRHGKMSAFHPKNPTKRDQWFEFKTSYCKVCGLERGKSATVPN